MAAGAGLDGAMPTLEAFSKAALAGSASVGAESLLVELKIAMMSFKALPPRCEASATAKQELVFARDVYEYATLYSLHAEDYASFERHFALARGFYTDYSEMPESPRQTLLVGLYIMHLLVENRLAEFHSELELLTEAQRAAPTIAFPISLEQALMEGCYNKVLTATRELPDAEFGVFVDSLTDAVRGEIAACSAASYKTLPLKSAQRMMLFDDEADLRAYISDEQPKWTVVGGVINFNKEEVAKRQVPSLALINNTLTYATELERIV